MRVEKDGCKMIDYVLFSDENGMFYLVKYREDDKVIYRKKFLRENKFQLRIRTVRDEIEEVMEFGEIVEEKALERLREFIEQ